MCDGVRTGFVCSSGKLHSQNVGIHRIEYLSVFVSLEANLNVQCDVGEFNLQQKPSYPRRFFSRVETRVDVWVSWRSNGSKDTSRVRDLSLGGLFVETAKSAAVGAWIKLHFIVQEGPIGAEAVVRHVKSGGLGLRLSTMGDEDQKRLKALITRLRK
jgi:hypothetical protein